MLAVVLFLALQLRLSPVHAGPQERWPSEPVAVVTGANRGIGFATVKRLCRAFKGTIFLTSRFEKRGYRAIQRLITNGCYPRFYPLDVTNRTSVIQFHHHVKDTFGGIDVLVNNAGSRYDKRNASFAQIVSSNLHVNFHSVLFLSYVLFPLLRPYSRVVNVGSDCGHRSYLTSAALRDRFSLENMTIHVLVSLMQEYRESALGGRHVQDGWGSSSYCVAKLAVTALTYLQQRYLTTSPQKDGSVVNCYNPGPVDTRFTFYQGSKKPLEVASNIVKLAMLAKNVTSPVGEFVWHDMTIVDWYGKVPDY